MKKTKIFIKCPCGLEKRIYILDKIKKLLLLIPFRKHSNGLKTDNPNNLWKLNTSMCSISSILALCNQLSTMVSHILQLLRTMILYFNT